LYSKKRTSETDESKEEGMRLNVKERFAGLAASSGFNHDAPEPPLELSSLLMFQWPERLFKSFFDDYTYVCVRSQRIVLVFKLMKHIRGQEDKKGMATARWKPSEHKKNSPLSESNKGPSDDN
jgi:hypothetical protein